MNDIAIHVSELQKKLMAAFWPGPLTLLLEKNEQVPDLCTAGTAWVAVRCPSHPVFRKILEHSGLALAAPSANRFGKISPVKVADVLEELGPFGLEAVVDGGACELGLESTVIKVHSKPDKIEVVRLGALPIERLRELVGPTLPIEIRRSGSGIETREAPGQLKSHYAPAKPLELFETFSKLSKISAAERKRSALLLVYPLESDVAASLAHWSEVRILSTERSDRIAASRLFSTLRELDSISRIDRIVSVEARPFDGLNLAINDRLARAAKRN